MFVGENGSGKTALLDAFALPILEYKTENFGIKNFNDTRAVQKFQEISGSQIKLDFLDNYEPFKNAFFAARKDNNQQISLNNLGSGYEMIFALLYSFYLAQQSGKQLIILTDEPELHLHPRLQEKFVGFLLEFSKNAQIILASHSPLLVKRGFTQNENIIIIAATNRPDILDLALTRPGRFDRQIVIGKPNLDGRLEILKIHSRQVKLAPDVKLGIIARQTVNFSGADLANVINEAAILAARDNKTMITMKESEEAVRRVAFGISLPKSRQPNESEQKRIAYHEAGHVVLATKLPNCDPPREVSIIARGEAALGYTLMCPEKNEYLIVKSKIEDEICCLFGGKAAEEIFLGECSTGSANDIQKATELAEKYVCKFGMNVNLPPMAFDKSRENPFLGKEIMNLGRNPLLPEAIREIENIIKKYYEKAKEIIENNKEAMERLVSALLKKKVLIGEEINNIIAGKSCKSY